jgi:hypothetical protein
MCAREFPVFLALLNDVHQKAFGEPLAALPHGKAKALRWFIEENTGQQLSYKTLRNYVHAALANTPATVNPNSSTLAILVRYVQGDLLENDAVVWYQYRARLMELQA